jgi:hypothetical protein
MNLRGYGLPIEPGGDSPSSQKLLSIGLGWYVRNFGVSEVYLKYLAHPTVHYE